MHTLQPKHTVIKAEEIKELTKKYNISVSQLPKIKSTDPALPEGLNKGEVGKIERNDGKDSAGYFRVVV